MREPAEAEAQLQASACPALSDRWHRDRHRHGDPSSCLAHVIAAACSAEVFDVLSDYRQRKLTLERAAAVARFAQSSIFDAHAWCSAAGTVRCAARQASTLEITKTNASASSAVGSLCSQTRP